MTVRSYKSYSATTIEWLPEVPAHWALKRLKHIAAVLPSNVDKKTNDAEPSVLLCNYTDVYYNERIRPDIAFMPATASPEQINRFTLRSGDTIITKDSETADDIAISAYVAEDLPGVICGYHLAIVRPRTGTCGAFIKRLFDSRYARSCFAVAANGLTRVGLSQYALDNVTVPFPPESEQSSIACFLDREAGKIDTLIAEQQRLVTLLREKRRAVIAHAVTRGLNPDAPMRDSGIEWVGLVPAHWDVKRLKFIADVQSGVAKGKDNSGRDTIEVPYLRVANVQDGFLDLETVSTIEIPASDLDRYRLRTGDVLMNEGGDFDKLGRGHIWHGEIDPCIHQNHVFAVRPKAVSPEWLNEITGSDYAQFYFMTRSKQSTNLASISSTNIMDLPVLLPPVDEQRRILQSVDELRTRFNELASETEAGIALLQERRSALISAAVTGKIDVCGLAATQPKQEVAA